MKILQCIRLYIKKQYHTDCPLLYLSPFEICTPYICEMFVYKHTETIEYVEEQPTLNKNTNFTGEQLENSWNSECEILRILFLYEHKHMERFSDLHECTFKYTSSPRHVSCLSIFICKKVSQIQCKCFRMLCFFLSWCYDSNLKA